ncbi:DUF3800 domain-containing protein [Cereibacter sphaeroides]|uniref:DUF3800 domain-containing protein n=1 Tax=Cereibacter sphaeroides TaxID=1063 RepID=A0AAX1UEL2_CERSP|nr:DUF3800 domain-containing protein [Cereibacter sphaeroides]RHZ90446.1 DUF3800 domain-containing protein [Cereibacter sphaeroides]
MGHHYTLFVDEAGDDKVERLKPDHPDGNSEWLCLGGYLVRAEFDGDLDQRRDDLLSAVGGSPGGVLHFQKLNARNRLVVAQHLATRRYPARGFVVCSFKRTMLGYHNPRAAAAMGGKKDALYNFVCRLLLERVTAFVAEDAHKKGIEKPILRIMMDRRKGHHFHSFTAYVEQLIRQAIAGTTYLSTRQIDPSILRRTDISNPSAHQEAGLQLADVLVSAFFQSIEQSAPGYSEQAALSLRPLMAPRRHRLGRAVGWNNEGVTLYPAPRAAHLITPRQAKFFEGFGYDMRWLKSPKATRQSQRFTQAERMWSSEYVC